MSDWANWVEHAKARQAAGVSGARLMLELAQRGASADEAEGVVRSLGNALALSAEEQRELQAQKWRARFSLLGGVVLVLSGWVSWSSWARRTSWEGACRFSPAASSWAASPSSERTWAPPD